MLRTLCVAVVLYAYGYPSFQGHRPTWLDKPLQSFHDDINSFVTGARHMSSEFNARAMQYATVSVEHIKRNIGKDFSK